MNGQTTISITTGTIVKTVVVLVAAWMVFLLRDLVLVVITAVVIASAIDPGVKALQRRKIPRVLGVLLVYILLFAAFFGIFYFFVPSVLSELVSFLSSLPIYLEAIDRIAAIDEYAQIFGTSPPDLSSVDLMAGFRNAMQAAGAFGNVLTAIASIFGGVLSFVLIVVFSFYFSIIETGVDEFLRVVSPRKYQTYVLDLWRRSRQKIGLWMQGQLLLGLIIGVLVYLILTILGIKHALLLAVIAALFELIPVFGPILAALPAVLIGFVDGGAVKGLLVVGVYVLLQQFENHLIYPLVVTKIIGVSPLLVILALIVGAELAGFLGILLAVPVAATVQELVKDVRERRIFAEESPA